MSMHVVIVDGDVSYPATSGKRLRTLNLMLKAARRQRITYVGRCAVDSDEARLAPPFLREHGIEPVLVHHPVPHKKGPAFYARLLGNLFSSRPYSVTSHYSRQMRQALTDLAWRSPVDVWQLEWTAYLPMLDPALPGARVVIAHNVDSLIWQRFYQTETRLLHKAFLKTQWHKFCRLEQQAFDGATRVVAVSEEDARIIRDEFGHAHVDVVDNGIDRAYFENVQGQRDPARILFLGALDWRPNLDAIDLLLGSIFPEVRAQVPQAQLAIVGRSPSPALSERVRNMPGVSLHADVPDVRPFLASSGVMAVPLRIGGGSRLKILEALACALPVVSTKVGAEGLQIEAGTHYVLAEADTMAAALVEAIRDPAAVQAMAECGRRLVLDMYDWEVQARKLVTCWQKSVGQHEQR